MVRLSSFCAAGAAMLSVVSAMRIKRQDTSDSFNLYAYSSNDNGENGDNGNTVLGGVPIFYADGLAWIGTAPPSNATNAANVTFVIDSSTTTLTVSSSNSTTNSTSLVGQNLYINPSPGAYQQVGFTSSSSSAIQTTTGFGLYGTRIIWSASDGTQQAFFYATPAGVEGLWALRWNSDNLPDGVSVPVSLVNTPPGPAADPMPPA